MKESQLRAADTLVGDCIYPQNIKKLRTKPAFQYPLQFFFPHFSGKLCQVHVEAAVVLQAAGGPGTL